MKRTWQRLRPDVLRLGLAESLGFWFGLVVLLYARPASFTDTTYHHIVFLWACSNILGMAIVGYGAVVNYRGPVILGEIVLGVELVAYAAAILFYGGKTSLPAAGGLANIGVVLLADAWELRRTRRNTIALLRERFRFGSEGPQ